MDDPRDFNAISKPMHYANTGLQPIQVIENWGMGYNLGQVLKYIKRAGIKSEDPTEDLSKAIWYLQRELSAVVVEHHGVDDEVYPPLGHTLDPNVLLKDPR